MKIKPKLGAMANTFAGISIGILICIGFGRQHFDDWDWVLVLGFSLVSVVLGCVHEAPRGHRSSDEKHSV